MADHPVQVIDIRNPGEVSASAMIPGARNIPLAELARRSSELDPNTPVLLNCAGGWRSSVGASLLRSKGFVDVSDLLGGYGAWGEPDGAGKNSLHRAALNTCGCASSCGVHGHDHAGAWSSKLPVADLRSFWGALGCACWAV